MEMMEGYTSAVRDNVYEWIKDVKEVDILVGIPSYNNEYTIAQLVSFAKAIGLGDSIKNLGNENSCK